MSIPEVEFELTDEMTFSQFEAPRVVEFYVCGVCWGELEIIEIENHHRVLVICPEHGSVCRAGRVTRNTVSINYEMASIRFKQVIHNVEEWKCLIPPKRERRPINELLKEIGF